MNRARKYWTAAEVGVLRQMATQVPTPELAEEMGRTPKAIKVKCNELRIARKPAKCGRPRTVLVY
jgi:hypothetical protein